MKRSNLLAINDKSAPSLKKMDLGQTKNETLGLMPVPVPSTNALNHKQEAGKENELSVPNLKPSKNLYVFTGNADRVIKWHKALNCFCYFEVISSILSLQNGHIPHQKVIFLRDKGPVLKVFYYNINESERQDFSAGQQIRCIGHMSGENSLTAIKIRAAFNGEIATLQRHIYVGDFSVSSIIFEERKTKETKPI